MSPLVLRVLVGCCSQSMLAAGLHIHTMRAHCGKAVLVVPRHPCVIECRVVHQYLWLLHGCSCSSFWLGGVGGALPSTLVGPPAVVGSLQQRHCCCGVHQAQQDRPQLWLQASALDLSVLAPASPRKAYIVYVAPPCSCQQVPPPKESNFTSVMLYAWCV